MDFGKLFSFEGRVSRKTFWGTIILSYLGFGIVGGIVAVAAIATDIVALDVLSALLGPVIGVTLLIVALANQIKRWHDRDKSGWWELIGFVPLIGPIWALIELGFLGGSPGRNAYGDPSSGSPFGKPSGSPQSPGSLSATGRPSAPVPTWSVARPAQQLPARMAQPNEHYVLRCTECDFLHHIPREYADGVVRYSVDVDEVRMVWVHGGPFTVTLGVKDFFWIVPVPDSADVFHASIRENMNVLHRHMLSHCDPLFLIVRQSPNGTSHDYRMRAEGLTYVRYSRDRGIEVEGSIDRSKAEIPGLSG